MARELKTNVIKTHMTSTTADVDLHWVIDEMKKRVDNGIIDWSIIQQELFPSLNDNQNEIQLDKDHMTAISLLQSEIKHHFYIYMKQKFKKAAPGPKCAPQEKKQIKSPKSNTNDITEQIKEQKMDNNSTSKISKNKIGATKINNYDVFCHHSMDINELKARCEPFQRIAMMLQAYKKILSNTNENEVQFFLNIQKIYDHQQLFNDFLHVKLMHIDADNNKPKEEYICIGKKICQYFEKDLNLKCKKTKMFGAIERHYFHRIYTTETKLTNEDKTFRAECDKVHIFFLQFSKQNNLFVLLIVSKMLKGLHSVSPVTNLHTIKRETQTL
eukprot:8129_1